MQSSIASSSSASAYSSHLSCRKEAARAMMVHEPVLHAADQSRPAFGLLGAFDERAGSGMQPALRKPCNLGLRHRLAETAMSGHVASQLARAKALLCHGLHGKGVSCLFMACCQLSALLADLIIAVEEGKLGIESKRKMLLMLLCAVIACEALRQLGHSTQFTDRHAALAMQQALALLEALEQCRRRLSQSLAAEPAAAACPQDWPAGLGLQLPDCRAD